MPVRMVGPPTLCSCMQVKKVEPRSAVFELFANSVEAGAKRISIHFYAE